jgi:hypothetical protein
VGTKNPLSFSFLGESEIGMSIEDVSTFTAGHYLNPKMVQSLKLASFVAKCMIWANNAADLFLETG